MLVMLRILNKVNFMFKSKDMYMNNFLCVNHLKLILSTSPNFSISTMLHKLVHLMLYPMCQLFVLSVRYVFPKENQLHQLRSYPIKHFYWCLES